MNQKSSIALLSIVVVILFGTAVYLVILIKNVSNSMAPDEKVAVVQQAVPKMQTQPVVEQVVTSAELQKEVSASATTEQKINNNDCGVIDISSVDISKPIDGANKIAMNCINTAIINCSPATVKAVGVGTSTISVINRDNNDCTIEQKMITKSNKPSTFKYYSICKFPIEEFIKPLVQSFEKEGRGNDFLWMGLNFMKTNDNAQIGSDGWYANEVMMSSGAGSAKYKCK